MEGICRSVIQSSWEVSDIEKSINKAFSDHISKSLKVAKVYMVLGGR